MSKYKRDNDGGNSFSYPRHERVGHVISEEISKILLYETKDPRLKNIVVTDVKLSEDMKIARIYFRKIDHQNENLNITLHALKFSSKFLRTRLGKVLQLKYVPELKFLYDDTLEGSTRIEKLFDEIKQQEQSEQTSFPQDSEDDESN